MVTAGDRRRNRRPDGLRRVLFSVLEPEADLEPDLEVGDLVIDDLATDLGHLEPVEVPEGLPGAVQRAADRGLDSLRRRADDLGDPVGALAHACLHTRSS